MYSIDTLKAKAGGALGGRTEALGGAGDGKVDPERLSAEKMFGLDILATRANSWVVDASRWYEIRPYEFVAYDSKANKEYVFSLPIPPESISVAPVIASEATPTLGGVTEETSENVFWTINMQGTTGMSVDRADASKPAQGAGAFRKVANSSGMISGALQGLADKVQSFVDSGNALSGALTSGDLAAGLNATLANPLWFRRSAVSNQRNGYYELLLLHKWLNMFSSAKEQSPTTWSLYFRNHKDNTEFRIVLKGFRMSKDKSNPYLSRYQIEAKGWQCQSPIRIEKNAIDRFAKGGDLEVANTLTVTGIVTKAKGLVNTLRRGPASIADSLVQVRGVA